MERRTKEYEEGTVKIFTPEEIEINARKAFRNKLNKSISDIKKAEE